MNEKINWLFHLFSGKKRRPNAIDSKPSDDGRLSIIS